VISFDTALFCLFWLLIVIRGLAVTDVCGVLFTLVSGLCFLGLCRIVCDIGLCVCAFCDSFLMMDSYFVVLERV
jgi:hypothetical protein